MPPNVVPLLASESGIITDVDIQKWLKFGQALEVKFKTDPSVKGYVVRFIGDAVSKDDPVVYVIPGTNQEVKDLQSMLDQSLRIERKIHFKGTDVSRLLEQLKTKTRLAVREEDDVLFDQFLDMYLSIFDLGIGLPAPPVDSLIPQLFSGWSVITTIIFHLGEIIEIAAQSRNEQLIRTLAFRLSIVVEAIIQRSDTHISESLHDILNLFVTIYSYGMRHNNQVSTQSPYSYLTESVIDRAWMKKFQQVYSTQEALNNLKQLLSAIFYTSARMIRSMIEHQDLENLKTLLNKLQPNEFLARFRTVSQQIEKEKWKLERQLRDVKDEEEFNKLVEQLQVRNSALNTFQEYSDSFGELTFVAASYTVEGYNLGEIEPSRANEILNELQPYLPTHVNGLANLLVRLTDFSKRLVWESFHRYPDTKQTFSPDDNAKFYLFYCLQGIKLFSRTTSPNELPIIELQHKLNRIEEFCNYIANDAEKWAPIASIIRPAIPEKVDEFWELHQQMKEKWQRDREEKIIAADLDPEKTLAFEEAFKEAIKTAPSLRSFLELKGSIVCDGGGRGGKRLVFNHRVDKKEYFTALYPDTTQAKQIGEHYGYEMARSENYFLAQEWVTKARTLRSRKDWISLEPYVERALAYLDGAGYKATLIIIPSDVSYYFLLNAPKFSPDNPSKDSLNLPGLYGFYNEIPVLQWHDNLDDNILVVDVKKISQLEIGDVKAEVKLLEESVRKRMLKDKPDLSLFSTHLYEIQHIVQRIKTTLNIVLEEISMNVSPNWIYLKRAKIDLFSGFVHRTLAVAAQPDLEIWQNGLQI